MALCVSAISAVALWIDTAVGVFSKPYLHYIHQPPVHHKSSSAVGLCSCLTIQGWRWCCYSSMACLSCPTNSRYVTSLTSAVLALPATCLVSLIAHSQSMCCRVNSSREGAGPSAAGLGEGQGCHLHAGPAEGCRQGPLCQPTPLHLAWLPGGPLSGQCCL